MLHDNRLATLFPVLDPALVEQLSKVGEQLSYQDGEIVFAQDQSPYDLWVVLEGGMRITKQVGLQTMTLAEHGLGEFAADITLLACHQAPVSGYSIGSSRFLKVPVASFRTLLADCDPVIVQILEALIQRTKDFESQIRNREKADALASLSAGLAHELNNPAAALRSLMQNLTGVQAEALRVAKRSLEQDKVAVLEAMLAEQSAAEFSALDRLALEEQWEAELVPFFAEEFAPLAASLADRGLSPAVLPDDASAVERKALLSWYYLIQTISDTVGQAASATGRIHRVVESMRAYSHLDRAELTTGTVHSSLEAALEVSLYRVAKSVRVVRDYEPGLPEMCLYTAQLTQVWTKLLDNAFEAVGDQGTVTIRTGKVESNVWVDILDDGPGIAAEHLPRVFDPFFTTKSVGKHYGLGLDVARRIVQDLHRGSIHIQSEPGHTAVRVLLPCELQREVSR